MAVRAPRISGEWVDSEPLDAADLRGTVTLVDFWDYTCVNCLRTLPYVKEWHRRYASRGFRVIGVHAPEFGFGRDPENVRRAIRDLDIRYPVVLDNGFETWRAFANRAWPSKYLIDKAGYIRYEHVGEGRYRETEAAIQGLLREVDQSPDLPPLFEPLRAVDDDAVRQACERPTPELYLGYRRGAIANAEGLRQDEAAAYTWSGEPPAELPGLAGQWIARDEYIESAGEARLYLPYSAAEVNAVMAPGGDGPGEAELFESRTALDHQSRGPDVQEAPDGRTLVAVPHARMYALVARTRYLRARVLELSARSTGLRVYAFTFGSCL